MLARILLVEDDPTISRSLEQALTAEGYDITLAIDGTSARSAFRTLVPDLVLLDLGLPDADGVELCREFRAAAPATSIVVLTARQEEADIVVGLDAGADDYITKPFRLAELLARVRAHLRRPEATEPDERVTAAELEIDAGARRAWVAGEELALRPREFDLLVLLVSDAGRAVSRERIMDEVWDENWYGSTKTLDVHVSALRRKLAEHPRARVPTITALPRYGYRLDLP
ncbi:MAG: chemotaxis protein CheY [Actinomycetia bacterium]|nr:chemotaxis protein CheY [Actinomycetes bacterium]